MSFDLKAENAKLKKIQSMPCPNCKKTGGIGFSFTTDKFYCNNCYEWTDEEAKEAIIELIQKVTTTYNTPHEKSFPAFSYTYLFLTDLTITDNRRKEWDKETCIHCNSTDIERDPIMCGQYYCNKCKRTVCLRVTIWSSEV